MFREIGLQDVELDYHHFLVRDASGSLKDNRMSRLTFGVTCSPYLATQVLRQIAEDYQTEFPEAARAIEEFFYVDDCLLSIDTTEEAISISAELVEVFSRACMSLRKWMSSSSSVMASIPVALREADQSTLSISPVDCPKTLWNTATDSLHIITPPVDNITVPSKRQVASSLARTFDVMVWYSPATVTLKILLQRLWALHLPWDDPIPAELLPAWNTWKEELGLLSVHPVPRYAAQHSSAVVNRQLHSYCDASKVAYGAVVYLRLMHEDTSVSTSIITSKTKVAPLSPSTIPRLELSGAVLLSRLLQSVAQDFSIPMEHVYAGVTLRQCSTGSMRILHHGLSSVKIELFKSEILSRLSSGGM